jgi:hypothetical protein
MADVDLPNRRVPRSVSICEIRSRVNLRAALRYRSILQVHSIPLPRITLMRSAFADDVTSMGSTLTFCRILRVSNTYSASLEVRANAAGALSTRSPTSAGHAGECIMVL